MLRLLILKERAVFATHEGLNPRSPHLPTPFFQLLLQTKHLLNFTQGWPLRGAWVALGPRLGHPRATQSHTQSQGSAEGRNGCPIQDLWTAGAGAPGTRRFCAFWGGGALA